MPPLLLAEEIRKVERTSQENLMERAGRSAATLVLERIPSGRILVLAGPGNNGGDAFVVARHLKSMGCRIDLVFASDPSRLPADAKSAHLAWIESGGTCLASIPQGKWDAVIDGLFGIGLKRDVEEPYAGFIAAVNAQSLPVFALDVPSGICSDTGRIRGIAVRASHTITFIAFKPGLLTSDGIDCCGTLHLEDLGLTSVAEEFAQGFLISPEVVAQSFPLRPRNSHKGCFGSVAVLGGEMPGAAILAARAALKLGAGKVYLCSAGSDCSQPEIMVRDAFAIASGDNAILVVGPGLGKSIQARDLVEVALRSASPLVIDADALNLIAGEPVLQELLCSRHAPSILTPHPLEAARLCACSTQEIQKDRVASARLISERFGCPVMLKGAGSVCAVPGGAFAINASGNPGLAAAGMGDVLSGMIGAYLAQGLDAERALLCAVHLHGEAADSLAEKGIGPVGLVASEIIEEARFLLNARLANPRRFRVPDGA
ncbi:MAG: NAD(P)H-hydrate dehydratase [Burkholderiales bacterium]|nr:NAD(P)H-hydrate dehydratase [Burkholderiales bacterium]